VIGVIVVVMIAVLAVHRTVVHNRASAATGPTAPRGTKYNQFSNGAFAVEDNPDETDA
jgi:hypothetical protein